MFSGRFSPAHLSHIRTLQRIAEEYDKVIVCVLDYPNRYEAIQDTLEILRETLHRCKGNFEIIINNVNLEHTTQEDMDTLPKYDAVGTGNPDVQANMDKLGIPWVHVERTPGYTGTDIRNLHALRDTNGLSADKAMLAVYKIHNEHLKKQVLELKGLQ